MRAMSLDSFGKGDEENELNSIKQQLERTNNLVYTLAKHLDDLREQVPFKLTNKS
jgi:hypothetical protein